MGGNQMGGNQVGGRQQILHCLWDTVCPREVKVKEYEEKLAWESDLAIPLLMAAADVVVGDVRLEEWKIPHGAGHVPYFSIYSIYDSNVTRGTKRNVLFQCGGW